MNIYIFIYMPIFASPNWKHLRLKALLQDNPIQLYVYVRNITLARTQKNKTPNSFKIPYSTHFWKNDLNSNQSTNIIRTKANRRIRLCFQFVSEFHAVLLHKKLLRSRVTNNDVSREYSQLENHRNIFVFTCDWRYRN